MKNHLIHILLPLTVMNTLLVTVQSNSVYSDNLIFNTDIESYPSLNELLLAGRKFFLEYVLFLGISRGSVS